MGEVNKSIEPLLVQEGRSLREAIAILDEHRDFGLAVVVDSAGRLVGILTNGDVYRAIFSGSPLDGPVGDVCNRDPVTLTTSDLKRKEVVRQKIKRLLERPGISLPILNDAGLVKDVLHYSALEGMAPVSDELPTKQRVLIIGGSGYLGTVLTDLLLSNGHVVRVLDNFTHQNFAIYSLPRQNNLEIVQGDIRDIRTIVSALEDVSSVVLLAAVVGDPAGKNNPKATIEINYLGAKMICEAARYAGVGRLLFASSCSVYGVGAEVLSEDSPLNPVSHYAKTKIAAEEAILSLKSSEFSPVVFRMGTLYGLSPRMRFDLVVNLFALHAVRKMRIDVFGGRQWRPLLHVRDASAAFVGGLEAKKDLIAGQVFNVGSEEQNFQIQVLAQIVRKAFPRTEVAIHASSEDARDYRVSFEKIRSFLGFKAAQSVEDAVKEIGEYVSMHGDEDLAAGKYSNNSFEY